MNEEGLGLVLVSILGWVVVIVSTWEFGPAGQQIGLFAAMGLGALYFIFNFSKVEDVLRPMSRFGLGHLYLSFFLSFLILLYQLDQGSWWIIYTLAATMIGDAAAYYTGRFLGRRPLAPAVSPKKTKEGLWGGLVGAGLAGGVVGLIALPVPVHEAALVGVGLGAWGTVGDLFESVLKRASGVKDSGQLLMGHGGFLDRLDAISFNVPIVYFLALFSGSN
jgi:phosphatidate cytidylyltransferase